MNLYVSRPEGERYGTYVIADPTHEVRVPNAEAGPWQYEVSTNCSAEQRFEIVTSRLEMVHLPCVLKDQ